MNFSISTFDKGIKAWSKPVPVINQNNTEFKNDALRINCTLTEYLNKQDSLMIVNIWGANMELKDLNAMLSSKLVKPFTLSYKSKANETTGELVEWYILTINSLFVQL